MHTRFGFAIAIECGNCFSGMLGVIAYVFYYWKQCDPVNLVAAAVCVQIGVHCLISVSNGSIVGLFLL